MMIDKLGGINPLNNVQSSHRTAAKASVSSGVDSISVSKEAQEMAEAYYLSEIAAETPDVRSDLVAQVKEKIQDPSYINSAVIDSVADRIMTSYGI
ncbi:flagellar biosynthesis anti-sigma factor FlgM [Treponema brennaborense]|uniref:Flagellar biosynthesis anti-sigma factor protein FlgM n=1 Tax=Treponema brennaborense (strain DSM 12168 / CIP 105900 / DD5/3) TaxID=906968 RepID=F4LNE9_TREBD|nr:flagellar biosynthesis anti-sigma factor FlgM [Treponema brennaborense]AEE17907.1 flagellar biosynthesis anti-sigma factor protein FlgM [Treponema brennaborense DSM 12168]